MKYEYVTLNNNQDKLDMLTSLLSPCLKRKQKILVFCNTVDSCRAALHHLEETLVLNEATTEYSVSN